MVERKVGLSVDATAVQSADEKAELWAARLAARTVETKEMLKPRLLPYTQLN
jgi:hypothetical protein